MSAGKWFGLGAGVAGVLAYVVLLGVLSDALVAQRSTWGVVALVVLVVSPVAALVVGLFWLWARTTSINIAARGSAGVPRIEAPRYDPAIEGEWRPAELEAGRYANGWPRPALPAPRETFLPVITQNGLSTAEARIAAARAQLERMRGPLSTPSRPVTSIVDTPQGRRAIAAELEALRKVCEACPDTPTRARCGVTSAEHSDALDILTAHGWIVRPGVRGQPAHWAEGCTRDVLLAWLLEVEERGSLEPPAGGER